MIMRACHHPVDLFGRRWRHAARTDAAISSSFCSSPAHARLREDPSPRNDTPHASAEYTKNASRVDDGGGGGDRATTAFVVIMVSYAMRPRPWY